MEAETCYEWICHIDDVFTASFKRMRGIREDVIQAMVRVMVDDDCDSEDDDDGDDGNNYSTSQLNVSHGNSVTTTPTVHIISIIYYLHNELSS